MGKKILIIIVLLLITTGCSCEYNLVIDNDIYKESITFTPENDEENDSLNEKWLIPIDKIDYENMPDYIDDNTFSNVYQYTLSENKINFTNNFDSSTYLSSNAVARCYNSLNITNYSGNTIISTNKNNLCFSSYPTLNELKINITVDKPVVNSNATSINGNTYTWIFTRNDEIEDKSINLVLDNSTSSSIPPQSSRGNNQNSNNTLDNYALYIIIGVMLLIIILGYFAFNMMKEKNNKMDD